jgi:hypothetical protein
MTKKIYKPDWKKLWLEIQKLNKHIKKSKKKYKNNDLPFYIKSSFLYHIICF